MENENLENQSGQVRKNPTRDNKNIKQGQANEESFSRQDASGKQIDHDEIDLDRSGIPGTQSDESRDFQSGAQRQTGSGQQAGSQGSNSQEFQQQAQQQPQKGVKQNQSGQDLNKNRTSGVSSGSDMGQQQNANRGGQQSGQRGQNQDDSRRQ